MNHFDTGANLSSPDWAMRDVLPMLEEINCTFLELLSDYARSQHSAGGQFLAELRYALCTTNDAARLHAARAPMLLLDFGFRNEAWWREVAADPLRTFPGKAPIVSHPAAVELARATLMLVWHLARANPSSALVLTSMSPPVARIIGSLRPKQLEQIAEHQYKAMRPRWEARTGLWQQLLSGHTQKHDLRTFSIRALQLCGTTPPSQ